jgi:hypothetical protein
VRDNQLAELALEGLLIVQVEQPRQLLRDRAGSLRVRVVGQVVDRGLRQAAPVDGSLLPEVAVLDGNDGVQLVW